MIALATPDNRIDASPLGVVLHGDALTWLKTMESDSVDAIVTDPPAGISFMSKSWDTFTGKEKKYDSAGERAKANANKEKLRQYQQGATPFAFSSSSGTPTKQERDAFIAFLSSVMSEALRVLKPGGHALVWALPRTSHWTALALEDAGFEVREKLYHIFGSGFPKSMDISKAIDKMQGAEREVVGIASDFARDGCKRDASRHRSRPTNQVPDGDRWALPVTKPATPEAEQWQGWGTATKPAVEEWILCRKPLSEPSIAANVLRWNCGALNIDACRVGNEPAFVDRPGQKSRGGLLNNTDETRVTSGGAGRWPANLLLSHSLWCIPQGTKRVRGSHRQGQPHRGQPYDATNASSYSMKNYGPWTTYTDPDGMEEVEAWQCAEDCPIRLLDEQSGVRKRGEKKATHHDGHNGMFGLPSGKPHPAEEGFVSRYFTNLPPDVPWLYTSKASRAERNRGCEGLPEKQVTDADKWAVNDRRSGTPRNPTEWKPEPQSNNHPTVKPLALMRWLIRLVTPPDGIVLDPFCGSGSTCVAAIQEGVHFIGIEQSEEYCQIAEARIAHARGLPDVPVDRLTKRELEAWGNVLEALFPEREVSL